MGAPAQLATGQPRPQAQGSRKQQLEPSPSYISSFVRECFTEDLCEVDFTQAIPAMQLLKVLEDRRRRELTSAIRRLSVDAAVLKGDGRGYQSSHPGLAEWIASMEARSKKVEALYTQVYIGLRRWVGSAFLEIPPQYTDRPSDTHQ